jgi:WD40 repeat protein
MNAIKLYFPLIILVFSFISCSTDKPSVKATNTGLKKETPVNVLKSDSQATPLKCTKNRATFGTKSYNTSTYVAFSPDRKSIASVSNDGYNECNSDTNPEICSIELWDLQSGEVIKRFTRNKTAVNSISFTPNGYVIAAGMNSGFIKFWDVMSGQEVEMTTKDLGEVYSIVFSPLDGKTIASGSQDATIKLWDVVNGEVKKIFRGHKDGVNSIAFSPNGETIVSGSVDHTMRLWNVDSSQEIWRTNLGIDSDARSIAFSRDGKRLVSGSLNGSATLWDATNGKSIKTFQKFAVGITVGAVAFSPDGKTIVSGDDSGYITLWDINSGRQLASEWHYPPVENSGVDSLAFSPDGKTIASGSAGTIKLWDVACLMEE